MRTARGLTQAQLATLAGLEQPNVSAIERDRREPTADTLARIADACGFELVARAGSTTLSLVPDDLEATPPPPPMTPAERNAKLTAVLELSSELVRVKA